MERHRTVARGSGRTGDGDVMGRDEFGNGAGNATAMRTRA